MTAAKPIKLVYASVVAKARKAYLSGTLQALTATKRRQFGSCSYTGCCAIGVSLPRAKRTRFDDDGGNSIESLLNAGAVECDSRNELIALQQAHDRAMGCDPLARSAGMEKLRELLSIEA